MKMQDNSKHSVAAMAAGLTYLLAFAVQAAVPPRTPAGSPVLKDRNETLEQHDARMAWWREAKFGMFITDSLKVPITAPPSPDGSQHTAHLRGAGSSFSQTIHFDAGSYTVSFDAVKRAGYGAKAAPLSVSVDGAVILDLAPDKLGDVWTSFTSPAFSLTAGSHTLTITLGKAEGDVMDLIDNVVIKYNK